MPVEVLWLDAAQQDLEILASYIAVDSEAAARRVSSRLERMAGLLSDHPRLGPLRSDLGPGLRLLVVRPYLILYRTIPDADDRPVRRVEIVGVVDGRRALERLF